MHKHALSSVAFVAPCLLVVGCGPGQQDLADLQSLAVMIHAPPEVQAGSFAVDLDYSSDCASIHATATLNGIDVPLTEAGSGGINAMPFSTPCIKPSFTLRDRSAAIPDANGISTLVISDASKTVTVGIRDVGVRRAVSVVSPADGTVTSGTRVTVAWTPSTDILDPNNTLVTLMPPAGDPIYLRMEQLTIEGANISFDMPALGLGAVTIWVRSPPASIASCDGAAWCSGDTNDNSAMTTVHMQ